MKFIQRLRRLSKAQRQGDFSVIRYADSYRVMCARSHESTDGRCVVCGGDSEQVHHLHYWSGSRFVFDAIDLVQGSYKSDLLPGEVCGRERWRGLFADVVPVCRRCHTLGDRSLHSRGRWINSRVFPVLLNRSSFWVKWRMRFRLAARQRRVKLKFGRI